MTRTTIKRALKNAAGGAEFIDRSGVKRCMGWGNGRTDSTLSGLDFIRQKQRKQYDIEEVADRIYESVEGSRHESN